MAKQTVIGHSTQIPTASEGRDGEERYVSVNGEIRLYYRRDGIWHYITLKRV